jgi:hypothetical protein
LVNSTLTSFTLETSKKSLQFNFSSQTNCTCMSVAFLQKPISLQSISSFLNQQKENCIISCRLLESFHHKIILCCQKWFVFSLFDYLCHPDTSQHLTNETKKLQCRLMHETIETVAVDICGHPWLFINS